MRFKLAFASILATAALSSAAHAEDKTIGLSWNSKENEIVGKWEEYLQSEAAKQGKEADINFKFIINVADNDPTRQAANIEDLINQGVDAIIARGEDSAAIGSSIRAAKRAGIPFVTFDHSSSSQKPDAHVSGDSYNQAKTTAEAFVALLKEKGVKGQCIELEGALKDVNAVNRSKAWHEVTDKSGVVTTLQTVPTEWNPELFRSGTVNAFRANPNANCIFLGSDFAITAVKSALESMDKWAPAGDPKHVYIATQDLFPDAVKAMEDKYIDVGTTFDAYQHAQEAIRVTIALIKKEDPKCSPEGCLVAGRIATPENVDKLENLWSRK
ncbi:sugar ABC transporter substrate-binding protein [Brucella pseudogrignonensis]|uniref:sugar ABC transporter substrate-binding protein n=1 Tax=Brucella pseudogrignonensis TaxID=419475 RepID=UPI0028BC8D66|nr:sugar ABC transporter substrate-binding protein [Brucella pseudogrignonensis]MDT6942434.1 sugar ABC transporter substrate-binding protein [Brucella pseudogrignonensis]